MSIYEHPALSRTTRTRSLHTYLPPSANGNSSSLPYVLKLAVPSQTNGDGNAAQVIGLTSAPSDSIHVLQLLNNGLRTTCTFTGHTEGTTSICSASSENGPAVLSAGKDGLVYGWDTRDPGRPATTCMSGVVFQLVYEP
jgi:WD40 repeat protein